MIERGSSNVHRPAGTCGFLRPGGPRALATFGLMLLAGPGCALHSVVEEPAPFVPGPAAWSLTAPAAPAAPAGDPAPAWWLAFEDPALTATIEQALVGNLGSGVSLARIAQSEATRRQAKSLYFPQLDGAADGSAAWSEGAGTEEASSAGFRLAWEIDLWGRLRSAAKARGAERDAAVADFEAVRLLLTASVAEAWYGAVEQRLQLALLDEQLDLATTLVSLTELRFRQGSASAVDVLQQRSVLTEVEGEVSAARARLRAFENRLDVLLGEAPDAKPRTDPAGAAFPTPQALPPLGVPAELLVRRPDLASLGRSIVAADHRMAAAIAARLPRITLTGSAAFFDPASAGAAFGASLLAGLLQPLYDRGRRKAAVDFARAVHEETLLAFSEAYLIALEEVETTLWQERQQRALLTSLARRVEILERTVRGTRRRYAQGLTDYLPVLTAVRELQAAQRELLTQERQRVSLRIRLYRALGGALPPDSRVSAALPSGLPQSTTGPGRVP